ncbi:MAG: DUF2911 domain-containing protein [Bacteroidetes bacterium]|nr:DUF2911 domain-containing protein [Bacteroidota bacterium]MBS1758313.1 DUF2911 domain-containing protein [Bacteroidota bacterium]
MKKILGIAFMAATLISGYQANAQTNMDKKMPEDKSKRPSPPATVKETIKSGATITINYSQPAVKGRTIGKDLEPMDGKVWRTGANEATVFETDKNVTIDGQSLPAGKYAFFTIFNNEEVTLIFNKVYNQWGAFKYSQAEDQLRVNTKLKEEKKATERLTFTISKKGKVNLLWGTKNVSFEVK